MKQRILNAIREFYDLCYTMFKLGAGDYAKNNFPAIVDRFWDDSKSDQENLKAVKDAFELEKRLQDGAGMQESSKVIGAFQEGWLNKIE
jgi:hypothetical protein